MLIWVCYGELIELDWYFLIFRILDKVYNVNEFENNFVRICYYKEKVVELNISRFKSLG